MSTDKPETIFRFTAEGVDLEFAGSEEFVQKQVQRFGPLLEGAIGKAAGSAAAAGEEGTAKAETEPESLEAFYAARPTREGRGAIQDRILLFIYYLQHQQGKQAVSREDITWCFQQVGLAAPKNLLNALGNMKRKLALLQGAGRRGLYQLSPKGEKHVEERFRP